MSIEERARRLVERELGVPVVLHDDGSAPARYDLRVGSPAAPQIAIECVGAVDRVRAETWNIGPGRGPLSLAVAGDWRVTLEPQARVKPLLRRLEALLQRCESRLSRGSFRTDWQLRRSDPGLFADLTALRISSVDCIRETGSGKVHLGMTGVGGAVDATGEALPRWLTGFLLARERADVLSKLEKSGAAKCHVFVPVSFGGVPWGVESYLGGPLEHLPPIAPVLPHPVTAAWITYGHNGLRWDGALWRRFDALTCATPTETPDHPGANGSD